MGENIRCALNYGHVGRPYYLADSQSWSFQRSFIPASPISHIGVTKTVIEKPSKTAQQPLFGPHGRPPHPDSIPHALPELGVQKLSDREHKKSQRITAASHIYDPHISTLLDLGYALDLGQEGLNHIPIAAAVTGDCRNIISLRLLLEDTLDFPFNGLEANIPTIGDTETAQWSTQGAPIRQVCFSQPVKGHETRSTWMAARLPNSTTIFRPLFKRNLGPSSLYRHDSAVHQSPQQVSRLDANPVFEISRSHTGGFPHTDVAFNPWDQRQVAILDMRGNWSLWNIQPRLKRRRGHRAVTPGQRSSLPSTDLDSPICVRHDGWGSIQWLDNPSTILVADRRCVMIFQMQGDEARSRSVDLKLGKASEWVLDVQRSKENISQFVVVTTTRLLWFDLATASLDEEGLRLPLKPSISWFHYRSPEDTTLRLSELLIGQNSYIILYSRISELIQVYPCYLFGNTAVDALVGADPFLLHMPPGTMEPTSNSPTRYSTLLFREVGHFSAGEEVHHASNTTLIKLYWNDSSYAVHETFFKGPSHNLPEQVSMGIGNTAENNRVFEKNRHRISNSQLDDSGDSYYGDYLNHDGDDLDDFIVEDWDESEVPHRLPTPQHTLPSSFSDGLEWTLSWERVYKFAVAKLASGDADPSGAEELQPTFDQLIRWLKNEVSEGAENWHNSETMLEISGGRPASNDMDQITEDLKNLSSIVYPESSENLDTPYEPQFMTLPLKFSNAFPQMPVASRTKQISEDFSETYDQLVEEWLTRLPHKIPLLTRRMKERIVRGIALDIILSRSIRIHHDPMAPKAPHAIEDTAPVEGTAATLRSDNGIGMASSQLASSQITATGERGQEMHDSPSKPGGGDIHSRYSSLSAFTTFKKPRPCPRNVTSLLSHWQPGVDPSTYDWRQASQAENGDKMGQDKSQRRSRKKRSQKSQMTPGRDSVSLSLTPVAPIPRTWGSQPDKSFPLASSQPTVDGAPMTQIERGQFGTRETTKSNKTKKKRRAGGF